MDPSPAPTPAPLIAPPPSVAPFAFPALLPVTADDRARTLPRNLSTAGVLPGNTDLYINGKNVIISGRNRHIIINDGTNDRVLIGFQSGGF